MRLFTLGGWLRASGVRLTNKLEIKGWVYPSLDSLILLRISIQSLGAKKRALLLPFLPGTRSQQACRKGTRRKHLSQSVVSTVGKEDSL